jgi:hypothetical protein
MQVTVVQSPSKAQALSIDTAIRTALKAAVHSYYQGKVWGPMYEWGALGVSAGWSYPISLLGSGGEVIDNTGMQPEEIPMHTVLKEYGESQHCIVKGIEWDYENQLYKISQVTAVVPLRLLPQQWEIDAGIPHIQSLEVTFADGVVKAKTKP